MRLAAGWWQRPDVPEHVPLAESTVSNDEQHCLERLEWHADQLSKLLQVLGGSNFVAGRDDEVVATFYGAVKVGLKQEADRCGAQGATLSKAEAIWLNTTVYSAYTALQASATGPIGREMYQEVVKAHQIVHRVLVEMRRRLDHLGE